MSSDEIDDGRHGFCETCGVEQPDGVQFCPDCGDAVVDDHELDDGNDCPCGGCADMDAAEAARVE